MHPRIFDCSACTPPELANLYEAYVNAVIYEVYNVSTRDAVVEMEPRIFHYTSFPASTHEQDEEFETKVLAVFKKHRQGLDRMLHLAEGHHHYWPISPREEPMDVYRRRQAVNV